MNSYVLHFNEIDKSSLPLVGGKGANLGEMTKAGFPVPQGFCITTAAYSAFVLTSDEMNKFFRLLEKIKYENLEEVRTLGQKIRDHLEAISIPENIQASVLKAWEQLGEEKAYAVRSSATAEDLPNASFAGQQETYLNVKGKEQILKSIKQCWASLFTDRAIVYRAKNGFDHRSVFLSVVVQEMVFPQVSGIMFTADPITGNRNTVSIDASFGLGEALVSGIVYADLYQVNRGEIIHKKIATKKVAIYPIPTGGTITENLPREKQEIQALEDEKIVELSKIGKFIEKHYGSEQDIEWCLSNNKFYIVQSRPITSLFPVPKVSDEELHLFVSLGHQQMMTDVLSPLARSIWRTFMPFGKVGSIRNENCFILEAGGRLFIDITKLLQIKQAQRILPKVLSGMDERMGSALKEIIKRPSFKQKEAPGIKKRVISNILPIAKNIQKNLFIRNPYKAINISNEIMKSSVKECDEFINKATGAERIRRIQESCGNFVLALFIKLVTYPLAGIVSMKLIQHFTKKWLGNGSSVHLLNKSLPGNVTTELGLKIGDLADIARENTEIINYLKRAEDKSFYEGLREVDRDGIFTKLFTEFISKYGMRCPGEIDISNIRWKDAPTLLVPSILSQVNSLRNGEHREKYKIGLEEAEKTAEDIILKLRKIPGGFYKAKLMSRLIKVYRNVMGLRETPKYIMVQHLQIYRKAVLEEGQLLVNKGVLRHQSEVFYLSLPELYKLLNGDFPGDVQNIIDSRKSQIEHYKKLTPPRVITSEGEIITGKRENANAPEGVLLGTPVSAGIVEGYARVVLKVEEANLKSGEILIAPFTDPGWTPLFSAVKGLVMEVGGMMTHGAVVAREYGLPAVVGIDKATEIIKDGDYIRINGTEGYVQILKEHKNE